MTNFLTKNWAFFVAVLIMYIFTQAYFAPQLKGKVLQASDMISVEGMSKEVSEYYKKTGENSYWTNSMFGGMPSYHTGGQGGTDYINALDYILLPLGLGSPPPTFYLFWGMLCFFICMCLMGINVWVSMIGAIAFSFSTTNLILAVTGHYTKLGTIAFFPAILTGAYLIFRKKYLIGAIVFLLGLAFNIHGNHIQMSYYFMITLLLYFIIEGIILLKEKDFIHLGKSIGILLFCGIIALLTESRTLLVNYDYVKDTMRGGSILSDKINETNTTTKSSGNGLGWEYATQWSNGFLDLGTVLVPRLVGGSSNEEIDPSSPIMRDLRSKGANIRAVPLYWGDIGSTGGPAYFGLCFLFLSILGMFYFRNIMGLWTGLSLLLVSLLSLGKNFAVLNHLLFDIFPMYNKFRAPSSIMPVFGFIAVFFGTYTLGDIINKKVKFEDIKKPLIYSSGILIGLLLIIILLGSSLFNVQGEMDAYLKQQGWNTDLLEEARISAMRSDAIRSLFLIGIIAGLIWFYTKEKLKLQVFLIGLGLLSLFDLWSIGKRYLSDKDFKTKSIAKNSYTPRPADLEILKDPDLNYRVLDLNENTFNSSFSSYFHKSIGGYSPAKLRRFQDIIDHHISKNNMGVLNMLNTKYIIGQDGKLQTNPAALGNAWFISKIIEVNSPDEEISGLTGLNPAESAVILKSEFPAYLDGLQPSTGGTISLTEYKPNKLKYHSENTNEGLAIFSEIIYRPNVDWKAYIDGKPVDHIRANYILRALRIPAGSHDIVFEFKPKVIPISGNLTQYSSFLAMLMLLVGIYLSIKNSKTKA